MLSVWTKIVMLFYVLISVSESCRTGCRLCDLINSTFCYECHDGHGEITDGHCLPCLSYKCSQCSLSTSQCSACYRSNGLIGTECKLCIASDCMLCDRNLSACSSCAQKWGITNDKNCEPCEDDKCSRCSLNNKECTYCNEVERYGVNELKICQECNQTECQECQSNYTNCYNCSIGGPKEGICGPCLDEKCIKCPSNYRFCTECTKDSFLQNSRCSPCIDKNCRDCSLNINGCSSCKEDFGLNNQRCECSSPCLTCEESSHLSCKTCMDGWYYWGNNTCSSCSSMEGCVLCNNSYVCNECGERYFLTENDICESCPDRCSSCFWNSNISSVECDFCNDPYEITFARPYMCGERCHNVVMLDVQCNFTIGVLYDGCTDDCKVEDGFECLFEENETISELCSYNESLKMGVISVSRERLSNRIVIKIIIEPILHVFTQMDIYELFDVDKNIFRKASIDFNKQTGEIILKADFNESLDNKYLQVFFKPSEKLDRRFFKTPESKTSFEIVELTFYSNFELTVAKIIFGLSYVAVGLGWSNIALGLVSKRLAGIETFVLFQIAFLTFMWIDLPLNEPLSQTDSLRHLNLPKIKELFSSEGLDQLSYGNITDVNPYSYSETFSKSPPHISNFDFQLSSFANNFNMALIFQIVPLFFFMIFTLVNCVFRYKIAKIIQETGDIPYTDEFTDSEYLKLKNNVSKVEKGKELSAQFLMCFTTLNMIGLANSLVLFLKYSAPPFAMNELIAIGISGGMLIITIILYFCDPDPFDYFRYAFRKQMLPLLTYFFFLATFVSTIVLFFMFPHLSWTAMIPFSVFFVYTLAYRPYKETKENYRAAFFILVILFVLSFRVFLQYSNKEENKMASYIYSLLIVVVLVLIGFGTMIFLIYKIVYFCYILPNLEKSEKVKIMEEIDITTIRQKMKFLNAEGSVFHQLMRNQMNIMDFSNSMRNLAVENNLDTENPNQQNLTNTKKKNAWKEQPHTGKNKNKHGDENSRIQNEDIQFHENFYNDLQKENEKIQQNIDENFEQYVKNREESEIECEGEDGKERRKKNFALEILAEENSFLGLKNAEQYVNEKKGEIKDKKIFMDEYEKIE